MALKRALRKLLSVYLNLSSVSLKPQRTGNQASKSYRKEMPLITVGPLQGLPPGTVTEFEAADALYAVCNIEGQLHCLEGTCPHAGGPLGQGNLNGTLLTCPWHGWEFDCRTGVNDFDNDLQLKTFPVIVRGGNILIDIP